MKKILLLLVCLFSLQTAVRADDDRPIAVTQLPASAQQFIKKHFSGNQVAFAKMEKDWFSKSYDVTFTNGNKLEFDENGEWTDIDCKYTSVPAAIVPKAIADYVAQNYKDVRILKIDRDTRDYEVKLSNRLELKFDLQFNLIDIDD